MSSLYQVILLFSCFHGDAAFCIWPSHGKLQYYSGVSKKYIEINSSVKFLLDEKTLISAISSFNYEKWVNISMKDVFKLVNYGDFSVNSHNYIVKNKL